jgi:hypothetical protein
MNFGQISSTQRRLPMTVVAPVTVVPMPVPVTVPTAMPVPVPMAMMMPAHFFRLDMVDFVLRYDRRLDGCASGDWH